MVKTNKCTIFLFALVFFLGFNYSFALEETQGNKVLTIEDCINTALDNSPNVKMAKNRVKLAKSRVGQAKSDYFPTANFSTGFSGQGDNNQPGTDNYYSANATLKQLIYNFGKTGAKINMQKFNEISTEFDLDNAVLDTVYNVKTAYYGVLAAKTSKEVEEAYVDINERQYAMTKAFFEEGLRSKIDLVNSEVNLSQAKISLVTAKNTYQNAVIKLNNAMYIAGEPSYYIEGTQNQGAINTEIFSPDLTKDEISLPEFKEGEVYSLTIQKTDLFQDYALIQYPKTFEECIATAMANRPDLKSYEATLSAMEESLKYAKREYFPELSGNVGWSFRNLEHISTNGYNYGASLNVPVGNVMQTKYKIDQSKAELSLAQNDIDLLRQDIYFEIQDYYVNLKQLEKKIPLHKVKVKTTLENLELAEGRYQVGLGNFIELQDAKVNYNQAQQAYVKAIYDYNVAKVKLEAAMGLIDDTNPIVTSFEDKKQ